MKNLIYKELHLSVHPFFYLLPLLLSLLFLIPGWIFTILFSYFFWISVSQIYAAYNAQEDHSFTSMLPVSKKEIVQSKVYTMLIIEGIHLGSGIIMGIVHVLLYGSYNFFLDVNFAFFGIVILMYSIFNIVFLPLYFKTGYYFGKAVIWGSVATLVYAFIIEYSAVKYTIFQQIVEGSIQSQLFVLLGTIIVSVVLNIITMKQSILRFERIL